MNEEIIRRALKLREKVDLALSLGFSAETIGATLMVEKGIDPGKNQIPRAASLDDLIISGKSP